MVRLILKDLLLVGSTAFLWWIIGTIIGYIFTKYSLHNNYLIYIVTLIVFVILYVMIRLFYDVYKQQPQKPQPSPVSHINSHKTS